MARGRIKLWQLIIAGPFLIWLGIHEYGRLDDLELHGGRIYVDKLTHFLYTVGGKNAVLICTVGFGIFYVYLLYRWWRDQQWAARRMAEIEAEKEPPPQPKRAPLEAPPRVDADPFRGPPVVAPVVVAPVVRKIETPVSASTEPTDGPKFLT